MLIALQCKFQVCRRSCIRLAGMLFLVGMFIHCVENAAQSVHAEENEHVIMAALRGDEGKWFRLAPRSDVLPDWPRRGLQDEVDGSVGKLLFESSHDGSEVDISHSITPFYNRRC